MAKHIVIERPNGVVTIVRSEIETASEEPLTEHEQIINELYNKVKNSGLFSVSQRSELLAFISEVDKKRKEYPIAHDEQIVDMILKANCG